MIDSTQYFVAGDGEPKGPYTLGQLIQLWRSGSVNAVEQFWTEADGRWRSLAELQLDAPGAELANMRWIRIYDPNALQMSGPFSMLDLVPRMQAGEVTPLHKFWWPGISHWIDFGLFGMSLDHDPNVEWMLSKTLSDSSQISPPPFEKQWSEGKQAVSMFGSLIGYAVGLFVLVIVILFLLFLMSQ